MFQLLYWVPVATSVILGTVYLFLGEATLRQKLLGVSVFLLAVCLQFFSSYTLLGLLLQVALALGLALWHKVDAAA